MMMTRARTYCLCLLILSPSFIAADVTHAVAKGETLYGIARSYGISLAELMRLNRISEADVTRVAAGTQLIISVAGDGESAESRSYVVQSGDTLYGIARRQGCTVAEIEDLNPGVEARSLRVGMAIEVPAREVFSAESEASGAGQTDAAASVEEPQVWPHSGDRALNQSNHVRWVQISGERGDDIVSVASGRVVWCAPYTVYRNVVIIEAADARTNEAYRFWYAGNEEVYVRSGDWIEKGTVIASMGVDPFDGAPRVSFAVTKGLKVIDHTVYSWH